MTPVKTVGYHFSTGEERKKKATYSNDSAMLIERQADRQTDRKKKTEIHTARKADVLEVRETHKYTLCRLKDGRTDGRKDGLTDGLTD